jgi:hypothetical protein
VHYIVHVKLSVVVTPYVPSTPGGIRTPNPRFRRQFSFFSKCLSGQGLTASPIVPGALSGALGLLHARNG